MRGTTFYKSSMGLLSLAPFRTRRTGRYHQATLRPEGMCVGLGPPGLSSLLIVDCGASWCGQGGMFALVSVLRLPYPNGPISIRSTGHMLDYDQPPT